jgi:hypothetical protein
MRRSKPKAKRKARAKPVPKPTQKQDYTKFIIPALVLIFVAIAAIGLSRLGQGDEPVKIVPATQPVQKAEPQPEQTNTLEDTFDEMFGSSAETMLTVATIIPIVIVVLFFWRGFRWGRI